MNQTDDAAVRQYIKDRNIKASSALWKKYPTKQARRDKVAPVVYARLLKLYGKDHATKWLFERFGEEKAQSMLTEARFLKFTENQGA